MKKTTKTNPENRLLSKESEIRGDMTIAEVAARFPETMAVFFKNGMTCFGCPMALQETVKQGAEAHGVDPEDIIKKLNGAVKGKKKK